MRIDPELCRAILIAVEGDPEEGTGKGVRVNLDGYERDVIAHHVKYLWDQKLLAGHDVTNLQSPYPEILITAITPKGRHYLDETEPERPKRKIGFQAD